MPPPKAYFRFSSGRFLSSRSPDANKNVVVSPWRGTIFAKDSLGTICSNSWAEMDEGSGPPGHPNRSGSLNRILTMEVCKVACDATITCSTGSPNPTCTRYLSTMALFLVKALGGCRGAKWTCPRAYCWTKKILLQFSKKDGKASLCCSKLSLILPQSLMQASRFLTMSCNFDRVTLVVQKMEHQRMEMCFERVTGSQAHVVMESSLTTLCQV